MTEFLFPVLCPLWPPFTDQIEDSCGTVLLAGAGTASSRTESQQSNEVNPRWMFCALLELLHLEAKNPPVRSVHLRITRAEIKKNISLRVLYIWNSVPLDVDVKGLKALGSLSLSELYTYIGNLKLCVFASRSGRRHKSSFAWLTNFLAKWAWNFHDTAK